MINTSQLSITEMPIANIIPYARNPRRNAQTVSKVMASIKEYGFRQPIVVDKEMVIVVGHVRLQAAQQMGLNTVPVHVAENLTPTQIQAYRIADNRTHEESLWDEELLALELSELENTDVDLTLTGFDSAEIDAYIAELDSNKVGDTEAVPDKPDNPSTKYGDIWQLGDHRVVCGDATDNSSYTALLGAAKADMIYTDPPYNVSYEGKAGSIKNDALSDNAFYHLLSSATKYMFQYLKEGGGTYVSYSEKETENFYRALREAGFKQSSCIIWVKNQLVLGRGDYHSKHEPIWYGWKPGKSHIWYGGRKRTTIEESTDILPVAKLDNSSWLLNWSDLNILIHGDNLSIEAIESTIIREDKPQHSPLHPTMKPVSLVERIICNSSKRKDIVLDCFGGSGTTLIAAENTGRYARLIELDPRFVDVIVKRWQDYTGGTATHALTGTAFGSY